VSPSREEARDGWLARNLALWQYYADHGASGLDDQAGDFASGRAVAGTPDDCIEQLNACRDRIGCDYVQLMNLGTGPSFGHAGSYRSQLDALELFGREVIPAFDG
jgi:alkanesulfonate monooxygenase SsuD/methylene tetrahydromethanopterin reductase-like flavin-dependent oxidoreductase (luciferase family)